MTKIFFKNGEYYRHEGGGQIERYDGSLKLFRDDFMLFGDIGIIDINIHDGSLDAKDARAIHENLGIYIDNSKAENINNTDKIWLFDNSSLSNSSTNELETTHGNNTINGVVSAKTVIFDGGTLSIAKNGLLKVPDKNALNFSKISGEGKVFDEKTKAYYDTSGHALNNANDLFMVNILNYNFALAKAIENKKAQIYIDKMDEKEQNSDMELLNIQMPNNDNML